MTALNRNPIRGLPIMFVLAILVAIMAVQVARASSAYADGESCEGLVPYTCIQVWGHGGTIEELGASHANVSDPQYCGYKAVFMLYDRNGTFIDSYSDGHSGCAFVRAWVKIDIPDTNIGVGGYVCAQWCEHGNRQGGQTCK